MQSFARTLLPAGLAMAIAASTAFAQSAPPAASPPGDATAAPAGHHGRHHMTPETMQRLQDGKFAMIKGALKLTDAQLKLWQPVEDLMRAQQAARAKTWADRVAGGSGAQPNASLADRMDRRGTMLAAQAEQAKAFAATFRPFYESLSPEQTAVVGPLMAELGGHRPMGGMGGDRWAAHKGHGDRGSPSPQ